MGSNGVAPQPRNGPARPVHRSLAFRLLLLTSVLSIAALGWTVVRLRQRPALAEPDPTLVAAATLLSQNPTASSTVEIISEPDTPTPAPTRSADFGTLLFAGRHGGRSHLWAIVPGDAQPIPLTASDGDDRDPAVSPDGEWLAFASHRDGNWDLYMLRLRSGEVQRLTNTAGYEAHPAWSPDGLWLAYEAYYTDDLDIWILPIDGSQDPIQLTNQPGLDVAPAWDPNGRTIAFISDRDGNPDLFLADLDNPNDRFHNLSRTSDAVESAPAFSPDGARLAYSADFEGVAEIRILDLTQPDHPAATVGQGVAATWSPDGGSLAAVLQTAYSTSVALYGLGSEMQMTAGLGGLSVEGSPTWTASGLPGERIAAASGLPTPAPAFVVEIGQRTDLGRLSLADLPDFRSPPFRLSDAVDEAFNALRGRVAQEAGWDFLGSLANAFVGLNDPLPPGFAYSDWLYTGRAFAFNLAAFQAGWVEVLREDFAGQTYWRVFVRASLQDGSLGEPLRGRPWGFDARFTGDPSAYDQGGALKPAVPAGYYIDFTRLAADFGFERLPAMTNWRTFYPAARFNEFARMEGMDWSDAMAELYPPEAVVTPTLYRTATVTPTSTLRPTPTPWWWRWRTPTPSRTPTPLATAAPPP